MSKSHDALMSSTYADKIRFWKKVASSDDKSACWNYTGYIGHHRYGVFNILQMPLKAHRCSYFYYNGEINPDLEIMHSCDNTHCCNPNHLSQGTHLENEQDKKAKGRHNYGTRNGNSIHSNESIEKVLILAASGKSQMKIANELGMSQSHIHRVLTGKTRTLVAP